MKKTWPLVLIVLGFGVALVSVLEVLKGNLSANAHTIAIVGESVGVGLGSIGLGALLFSRR